MTTSSDILHFEVKRAAIYSKQAAASAILAREQAAIALADMIVRRNVQRETTLRIFA